MVSLKINGRDVTVEEGTTILNAAKKIGIEIPTFCYHPGLKPFSGCRVCMVEIEGRPGVVPSCSTLVCDGMSVLTDSPLAVRAQQSTIEFLLLNHALDCPVCDQGGECELQEISVAFGTSKSRYKYKDRKRKYEKVNLGSLVEKELNRCVHCYRCVRYYREIAGGDDYGILHRGSKTEFASLDNKDLTIPFAGNLIDMCPVGALTSKPFRFRARVWELKRERAACELCQVGCDADYWYRENNLLRLTAPEGSPVNEYYLCDKGRFGSLSALTRPPEAQNPRIREDSELSECSWNEAITFASERLGQIIKEHGAASVAGVASGESTNEAGYVFSKLIKGHIGSNNLDILPRCGFISSALRDSSGLEFSRLDAFEKILVLGSRIEEEAPVLSLRLRRLARSGTGLAIAYPGETALHDSSSMNVQYLPGGEGALILWLERLLEIQLDGAPEITDAELAAITGLGGNLVQGLSEWLGDTEGCGAVLSPAFLHGKNGEFTLAAVKKIFGDRVLILRSGSNSLGLLDMGLAPGFLPGGLPIGSPDVGETLPEKWGGRIPESRGADVAETVEGIRHGAIRAVVVLGTPYEDVVGLILDAITPETFVVLLSSEDSKLAERSSAVLPVSDGFLEGRTFTNSEGRIRIAPHLSPRSKVKSALDALTELAQVMGYTAWKAGIGAVQNEIAEVVPSYSECGYPNRPGTRATADTPVPSKYQETRITNQDYPLYLIREDSVFCRDRIMTAAGVLDHLIRKPAVTISRSDADSLGLNEGDMALVETRVGSLELPVVLGGIRPGVVAVPANSGGSMWKLTGPAFAAGARISKKT
jgi:NADH-quinone oxidoreductase subunit G